MTPEIKKALDLALEALEPFSTPNWAGTGVDKANAAITAIRQVRSAPVQESVAHCEAGPAYCQQCHLEDQCLALAAAVRYVKNNTPKLVSGEICMALSTPPAQPAVQDAEGENKAVRSFLMLYGQPGLTVGQMKKHMTMSGFKAWPAWVDTEPHGAHLTKAGAQLWIRHLFALEATPPTAQPAPVQEPVGYTDGDGRAWAVKWSGALPPNLTLFAIAINHLQEKTMAKHIDPRKGGSHPRESP